MGATRFDERRRDIGGVEVIDGDRQGMARRVEEWLQDRPARVGADMAQKCFRYREGLVDRVAFDGCVRERHRSSGPKHACCCGGVQCLELAHRVGLHDLHPVTAERAWRTILVEEIALRLFVIDQHDDRRLGDEGSIDERESGVRCHEARYFT